MRWRFTMHEVTHLFRNTFGHNNSANQPIFSLEAIFANTLLEMKCKRQKNWTFQIAGGLICYFGASFHNKHTQDPQIEPDNSLQWPILMLSLLSTRGFMGISAVPRVWCNGLIRRQGFEGGQNNPKLTNDSNLFFFCLSRTREQCSTPK